MTTLNKLNIFICRIPSKTSFILSMIIIFGTMYIGFYMASVYKNYFLGILIPMIGYGIGIYCALVRHIMDEGGERKKEKQKKSLDLLKEHLANMTEQEKEEMREHFRDKRPKGWLSIEEHLPMMRAMDIMEGHTKYKVMYFDGREGISGVSDHNTWYYHAKEDGITHWFNE